MFNSAQITKNFNFLKNFNIFKVSFDVKLIFRATEFRATNGRLY